jgi:hypothetical protein
MTEQEIIDGNILIAKYMEYLVGPLSGWISGKNECAYKKEDGEINEAIPVNGLKYHKSWDVLMPVIEKISKHKHNGFPLNVTVSGDCGIFIDINHSNMAAQLYEGNREIVNTLNINYFADTEVQDETYSHIMSVWVGVVQFVNWFNSVKIPV